VGRLFYLEIRDAPEHRLNGLLQGKDPSQFVWMLPIRVVRLVTSRSVITEVGAVSSTMWSNCP
jgi:hypothetical protein